ncbi:RNA-binding domain-containing protein [Russula ochroleuca]|uniref:RNA-binding domain-containing protein n=1 Tax=Russula ochroleuca TaxID=152965 RepID=A0A9P5TBM7_9AGAM|nr:RNA-binding domain-containing protein [Russula ochroleuca]
MSTLGKRKNRETSDSHGSTFFVSNLPYTATSTDLKTLFSDIAPVRSAFVVLEHGTGASKGVGYVSFAISEDAKAAFDSISADGITLDARQLRIEWAANRPSRAERGNKASASPASPIAEGIPRLKAHLHTPSRDPLAIRTVVISGLPPVDSKGLWKKIRKYEGAGEVQWPVKRDDGVEDASTAHVLFSSPATAQDAVNKLHAHVFKGALLSVTLKKRLDGTAKLSHTSTPIPSRANRLIVRNLPFDITEQDLRAIFLPHGSIYSIDIPRIDVDNHVEDEDEEPSTPLRGKGFAFVWMWNRKEAETAMNACNGMQVRAGFATDLIKDKQKKKKTRREEKKEAATSKALDDPGRTIAVDWALSKSKWEEKGDVHEEKVSESQGEQGSDEDTENLRNIAEEPDECDDGEGSINHSDHEEAGEDVSDEEKARPSLPQPEAGTTLFIRNLPFLATEDELRTLFRKFGPLRYARITTDVETGRSRGTGFVCFWNRADADTVVEKSNSIRADMTGAVGATLPKKNPFAMASILTPDPSAASAQSLVLHGRTLDVVHAVTREEAGKLKEAGEKAREKADKRNMYLLREGVILPNSPAAETLPSVEIQKRSDSYNARRALLGSNPSLYVSKTRLSIRQIPTSVTERMLKRLATHAIQTFDEEVVSGSRTGLSEEEMSRDESASDGDKTRIKGKAIPRVRQAKIVRQADRVDALTGRGRSKGYGFLELREHADALRVLRWANNNSEVSSLFSEWWLAELAEEKKDADPARAKRITEMENRGSSAKQPKGSLIVEFSIENTQVVRRRAARQTGVSIIPNSGARSNLWTHLGRHWGEEEATPFKG